MMVHEEVREVWEAAYHLGYRHGRLAPVTPAPAADKDHAAPTYISGSSDRVYLISEMPTRYIRNVLAMDSGRQARGLDKALIDELTRRGERAWA